MTLSFQLVFFTAFPLLVYGSCNRLSSYNLRQKTETVSQRWPRRWFPSGNEKCVRWLRRLYHTAGKKGFPALNRGPCQQRLQMGGRSVLKGGWKHLQPECGNQLLNLSGAVGRHGNSGRPWLALSNPAVPGEKLLWMVRWHTQRGQRGAVTRGQSPRIYKCAELWIKQHKYFLILCLVVLSECSPVTLPLFH